MVKRKGYLLRKERICILKVIRLATKVRRMFILSKGNCYSLIVGGTQKRTIIKVFWILLFPRGKDNKIKIKNDRERKLKKCFKGNKMYNKENRNCSV